MKNYFVYCHKSPSGKKYVGISQMSPQKRWANGAGYKKNFYFYRAIKKYGWNAFEHEILYQDLTLEEAKAIEIFLNCIRNGINYNLTSVCLVLKIFS